MRAQYLFSSRGYRCLLETVPSLLLPAKSDFLRAPQFQTIIATISLLTRWSRSIPFPA
jgi:hypothetical protein